MDGPAHLYNASLLNYYGGSDFLKEYYILNSFYLPNYLPHFILKNLLLFFNPFTAEKIFLSLIVCFLPLSFRSAVTLYSRSANNFSFIIFSLVFSSLFNSGFFSFALGFLLFNCLLILVYYFLREKNTFFVRALLVITTLLLFYTHPFVFAISIPLLFLMILFHYGNKFKESFKSVITLLLLYLPSLILFLLFYTQIHISSEDPKLVADLSVYEKFNALYNFFPGITFVQQEESVYTSLISLLIIFLLSYTVVSRFILTNERFKLVSTDVFLLGALVILPAIFLTHNGLLGGMFTPRLVFLFFYILFFWICCNKIDSKPVLLFTMVIIAFTYINLSIYRHGFFKELGYYAKTIVAASYYIPDKSVVYLTKYTQNYLYAHFSNYVGIGKEVVITENYEAVLGWFPLKWTNKKEMVHCVVDTVDNSIILPDYVLMIGDCGQLEKPANKAFKKFIDKKTFQCYQSQYGFCRLYKVIKEPLSKYSKNE